jgi:tetratricopeptide (TPR) repeat protein
LGGKLQISVGDLSEIFGPVLFLVAAFLSARVFYDSRRRGSSALAVAGWTILTLLLPPVILPLYLTARMREPHSSTGPRRLAAPIVYFLVLVLAGGAYFYRDYTSFDAHFGRARRAQLLSRRESAIREFRSALEKRDDPHTHKLLGMELLGARRWEEALSEFRAAELGGEPDPTVFFREAFALEMLERPADAAVDYQRFLESEACTRSEPDTLCGQAMARLSLLIQGPA